MAPSNRPGKGKGREDKNEEELEDEHRKLAQDLPTLAEWVEVTQKLKMEKALFDQHKQRLVDLQQEKEKIIREIEVERAMIERAEKDLDDAQEEYDKLCEKEALVKAKQSATLTRLLNNNRYRLEQEKIIFKNQKAKLEADEKAERRMYSTRNKV